MEKLSTLLNPNQCTIFAFLWERERNAVTGVQ